MTFVRCLRRVYEMCPFVFRICLFVRLTVRLLGGVWPSVSRTNALHRTFRESRRLATTAHVGSVWSLAGARRLERQKSMESHRTTTRPLARQHYADRYGAPRTAAPRPNENIRQSDHADSAASRVRETDNDNGK